MVTSAFFQNGFFLNYFSKLGVSSASIAFLFALPPLIGKGINARMIDQIAGFVTGACSCQVKAQNPGTDLLIQKDWDAAVLGKGKK